MKRGGYWLNQVSRLWQQTQTAGRSRWWRQWRRSWRGQRRRLDHWSSEFSFLAQQRRFSSEATHSGVLNCRSRQQRRHPQPWIGFVLVVLILTVTTGQQFYNQPQLRTGAISPETFIAPEAAKVEDTEATEERRRAVERGSLKVWQLDQDATRMILDTLDANLLQIEAIRRQATPFPFVLEDRMSLALQQAIRQASPTEWDAIWAAIQADDPASISVPATTGQLDPATVQSVIEALVAYRETRSDSEWQTLITRINNSRQSYTAARQALQALNPEYAADLYPPTWLTLSPQAWQVTRAEMVRVAELMTAQGIAPGTPPTLLEQAVDLQVLATEIPTTIQPAAQLLILRSLTPNLIEDEAGTIEAIQQAVDQVDPVMATVDRDQVIVQAGDEITSGAFALLDHFGLSQRGFNGRGLFGFGMAVTGAVALFLWVEHLTHPGLRRRDYVLILLMVLTNPLLLALEVHTLPLESLVSLPAIGLLVGTFYGAPLGVSVVILTALILPLGLQVSLIPLLAAAVGGVVGSLMASRLRSREELALLGGGVGLAQATVYLGLTIAIAPGTAPVWYHVLAKALLQGLIGLCWSIVALGISPYLEHLFDLVTAVRLAELSNPNRPLLKRLAAEAPGTFQHTMFVASLAEAAARALHCNVELVRAGTLYHDIGKMHDPLGFIENQMGAPNKHDQMQDPWRSAEIIRKHVTEGIVMAKKHRLPKAVRAFIPEHQGTMLISYFHHQAQTRAKDDPTIQVKDEDFRYAGPIPQSRETGIVMLADSCEAALRSLKDATPAEAFAMVNRILRARWKDRQLIDSGLTRTDMDVIAEVFIRVWQQFNHQRIPYPKPAVPSR